MPSKTHPSGVEMNVKDNVHVIDAAEEHSHTIILLHGRECTATDFASELLEGQASDDRTLPEIFPSIKWVFLNSGTRTYSRFGSKESQWFDMWDMRSPQERKDLQIDGLRESIAFILSVIRTEAAFVPPERIIIGGISQGSATAIHALLSGGIRVGAFIGLSTWLPFQDDILQLAQYPASDFTLLQQIRRIITKSSSATTTNSKGTSGVPPPPPLTEMFPDAELAFKTPVFLSHSRDDEVVPFGNGDMCCWALEEVGFDVEWRVYERGGHWVEEPRGFDDIIAFLGKVIKV